MFYSLSGYSPFAGENDLETFVNITEGGFDFEDEVWNEISDDAKDFIKKLMVKDKSKRMTIDEALEHPWLNVRLLSMLLFSSLLLVFLATFPFAIEVPIKFFKYVNYISIME